MAILVTGGTGYIGSHAVVELLQKGEDVVIIDNYSNSKKEVLESIEIITEKKPKFYEGDCRDYKILDKIFEENKIDSVMNFAGYKAVGESAENPLLYYNNNLVSAIALLETMQKFGCRKFIFSSTSTVYGDPEELPLTEECKTGSTTNPYSSTKTMIERFLIDLYKSDNTWDICILRYFNVIGAHESGIIGEEPNGVPNNLMPYIMQVASRKREYLNVYGNDYNTKDGTGIRDYIHVVDLAKAHVKALEKLNKENTGLYIYNVGTGKGYSVLDIINNFEKVNNIKIPYRMMPRRTGDVAALYANPIKAKEELEWVAEKGIVEMCRDSWNFEKKHM